ncbi:MAG: tRNA uridine(34) 5-carboxymethylaminomethyl modification radical SAM/GNAT enzyme Elp3 [Anaerolineae bacterium]|uniref:elongator complex protein 3 n=1 Tax=Candidatus Amarolinea dominans TaxID=3140696 RepID=UPI0031373ECE|nr:tRNA uridine(34) 5-carboxymethylaminomethyl modification radical SAM/GNAT enzyme Elp3 [Anaerolineae bacterium]
MTNDSYLGEKSDPFDPARLAQWRRAHADPLDLTAHEDALLALLAEVQTVRTWSQRTLDRLIRQHLGPAGAARFTRDRLVQAYQALVDAGKLDFERETLTRLQRKPTRTISGVAPVAVLTKPYACPGACIFCPTDEWMPKSYLRDEPGAQRAYLEQFDPFSQTAGRIAALETIGHAADKIELLILGGTWSAYPRHYQETFVLRCLEAMNEQPAVNLAEAQRHNESAPHRNVGLVIETRPDWITPQEVLWLRRLGVTKVQLGIQSLDDRILALNKRGHTVEQSRRAVRLLRAAGFKLHLHWMPNLLGATPESDLADFQRLWSDPALRPDELKIYPCSLLEGTELMAHWRAGHYRPYTRDELLELLIGCKALVPPDCRLNRVIRDIPSDHIVAGNRTVNLRQVVQQEMARRGLICHCIRCQEVRGHAIEAQHLTLDTVSHPTDISQEWFLRMLTPAGRLAGFLRLSLPRPFDAANPLTPADVSAEIQGAAMIREVHVVGPALVVGADSRGEAQHVGVGRRLVAAAQELAQAQGFKQLTVIAAAGTRDYYRRLGFELGDLYMHLRL